MQILRYRLPIARGQYLIHTAEMKIVTLQFANDVYEIVAAIPSGRVLTYGRVATLAGYPNHARLVGHVMRGATASLGLPCHRVVGSDGHTAPCWPRQRYLLEQEGVQFKANGNVDLKAALWDVMTSANW